MGGGGEGMGEGYISFLYIYIYSYDALKLYYVKFVYENDTLMRNWVGFIYTKFAKKKSPHESLQVFAHIPSRSRDFFPN